MKTKHSQNINKQNYFKNSLKNSECEGPQEVMSASPLLGAESLLINTEDTAALRKPPKHLSLVTNHGI